jgi:hypothetical protein
MGTNLGDAEPARPRRGDGGRAAIASIRDQRIIDLANQYPSFRSFIASFNDAFGVQVEPSVLIVKTLKSKPLRLEPLASFRDLVALSVIPYQRAQMLVRKGQMPRILYSNVFYLYPWMLDKNYQHLMTNTLSGMGIHMPSKFGGQSSPDIFPHDLHPHDIDETLLESNHRPHDFHRSLKSSAVTQFVTHSAK